MDDSIQVFLSLEISSSLFSGYSLWAPGRVSEDGLPPVHTAVTERPTLFFIRIPLFILYSKKH